VSTGALLRKSHYTFPVCGAADDFAPPDRRALQHPPLSFSSTEQLLFSQRAGCVSFRISSAVAEIFNAGSAALPESAEISDLVIP
jgi:hypothetical protein